MMHRIHSSLTRPRRVVGVAVTLLPEARQQVDVCVLRRQGDRVVPEQQHAGLSSLDDLAALDIAENIPVALVILGRGIVHKTFAPHAHVATEDSAVLAALLPGALATDFHIQQSTGSDYQHLALVRRSTLEALVGALQQQGRYVIAASLGPFAFEVLLPYLADEHEASYQVTGYTLATLNQQVTAVQAQPLDEAYAPGIQLGDETIATALLLPYAAALATLTGSAPATFSASSITQAREEWEQKQLFRLGGIAALAGFLLVLLLNFVAFSYLTSQNQALLSQGQVNRRTLSTLNDLQRSVTRKQEFLAGAGWLQSTRHSTRADQLGATVPAGLRLLTIDSEPLNPVQTSQQQRPVFDTGTVRVKGQCREAQVLNGWLQQVSALPWVQAVRDQNFTYDYSSGTGLFTFTIHTADEPPRQP
ncbi:hypothetical protein J0X19_22840 [Hymenobacter sp. BT186]|uniref:Uncharacterized protein n=1 Tax=Hymenobacter telluris TaxID=2816474 RepID=A0A939F2B9_9BACT|nr:hypothetical protein [Hymenobacter telluris]MBO0360815.1 hypothetical protein [Hymenobacter telluris]MBW3376844.1 hypothetical protein [Hymenobacter norwichensis]